GLAREDVEAVLGHKLAIDPDAASSDAAPIAPGLLRSHYAPKARVRLNATEVRPDEALLAFGMQLAAGAGDARKMCNLSKRGSLGEAAANLFSHLRLLDAPGVATIAVMPIPNEGLGEAINDRLQRAATPR